MVQKVFSVYDSKAEAYLPPFMMTTKGQAIRAFQDAITDGKSQFCKHPQDYTLFEIAEFDDSVGTYVMHIDKKNLGLASEYAARSN